MFWPFSKSQKKSGIGFSRTLVRSSILYHYIQGLSDEIQLRKKIREKLFGTVRYSDSFKKFYSLYLQIFANSFFFRKIESNPSENAKNNRTFFGLNKVFSS